MFCIEAAVGLSGTHDVPKFGDPQCTPKRENMTHFKICDSLSYILEFIKLRMKSKIPALLNTIDFIQCY